MAHSEHGDVTRIEIEFEDGTTKTIEGDDAERWGQGVDSAIGFARTHGQRMPTGLDWEYDSPEGDIDDA